MKSKTLVLSLAVLNVALMALLLARDRLLPAVQARPAVAAADTHTPVSSPPPSPTLQAPASSVLVALQPTAPVSQPPLERPTPPPDTQSTAPASAPATRAPSAPRTTPEPPPGPPAGSGSGNRAGTTGHEPVTASTPATRRELPAGTAIGVSLDYELDSAQLESGAGFDATLSHDLVVNGHTLVSAGNRVEGLVRRAVSAGRVSGVAELELTLTGLTDNAGRRRPVHATSLQFEGARSHKQDAVTVGAASAVGAIIGGIAKGGRGAATGAAAGAAAGTGVVLATRGESVRLEAGRRLEFRLQQPLSLTRAD